MDSGRSSRETDGHLKRETDKERGRETDTLLLISLIIATLLPCDVHSFLGTDLDSVH